MAAYQMNENNNRDDNCAIVIGLLIICLLIICTHRCSAQKARVDTMICKVECIHKLIEQSSTNGKSSRYFAVYEDKSIGFSEIIPVSKNVVDYIQYCKEYRIKPNLGITLKNGVISRIVRYKIKFKTK